MGVGKGGRGGGWGLGKEGEDEVGGWERRERARLSQLGRIGQHS